MKSTLLWPLLAGLMVISVPVAGALLTPAPDGQVAALYPPGWSQARILTETARGEARIVRFGSISNIAILEPGPGGAKALRAGGALLVFDPLILGGCLTGTRPIGATA
jgi:hypothetical protein